LFTFFLLEALKTRYKHLTFVKTLLLLTRISSPVILASSEKASND